MKIVTTWFLAVGTVVVLRRLFDVNDWFSLPVTNGSATLLIGIAVLANGFLTAHLVDSARPNFVSTLRNQLNAIQEDVGGLGKKLDDLRFQED